MNENIYIKTIRYGFQKMESGVSFKELIEYLNDANTPADLNFDIHYDIVIDIYLDVFLFTGTKDEFIRNLKLVKENQYQVKLEAYLKLMQYDEHQLALRNSETAIKNSRLATKIAIWSIVISGIIALSGLIFSIIESTK